MLCRHSITLRPGSTLDANRDLIVADQVAREALSGNRVHMHLDLVICGKRMDGNEFLPI